MMKFCNSITRYSRAKTVEVRVGVTAIGGGNPVRLQSMANTDTLDTAASAAQALRIVAAGGELVRFTAQGPREAHNLANIRERIRAAGCTVPLVADIHFNPEAAFIAAAVVEKVRINPGNFNIGKFPELLDLCEKHGTALRIGVNHGSLSPRIMEKWGDTPRGMVESAMEYLKICRGEGFDRVVVSMKSSNVRVMVHAYRLLAAAMRAEGMNFPLHLGVTEAGDGEDARVKSAAGMGALLADGLGDTVRVSLTEPPENEIPVARKLTEYFEKRESHAAIPDVDESLYNPYEYVKRRSSAIGMIGGDNPPVVVFSDTQPNEDWLHMDIHGLNRDIPAGKVIVLETSNTNGVGEQRAFFLKMTEYGLSNPVIIRRSYAEEDMETLQIKAAADIAPLFIDGFGDGVWIDNVGGDITADRISSLAFSILQAARVRITRTEYIACPGCGRTLFDLQTTLARVKAATTHLTGLRIGVMGCIVNGPGEMADADYGYVGAGPGKVTLYKGRDVIKRNIDESEAIDELLGLITN